MNTFNELPLLPTIQQALHALGFTKPTEIQAKTIPLLLENLKQHLHGQAQTGTGKTLAFGIPLLHAIDTSSRHVQGLIIAPTRELILQIYESLRDVSRDTGITIEAIYGGMPINRQINHLKRGAHIIVGTPGRLNDHLRRKTLTLSNLKVLVLDEADIMLDMGFKSEIDEILVHAPKDCAVWLFSATVRAGIKDLIKSHMKDVVSIKATSEQSLATPQVQQYYCVVPRSKRVEALSRFIEAAPDFYGIIFCQTKMLTQEVMEQLAKKGYKVNCLHGDMKQASRNNVIRGFKNREFNILVATDVAARGIDVSDLTHVINFSLPEEFDTYVHRIGRTGRAGKEGIAILFITPSELKEINRLEKITQTTIQEIPVPLSETIINAKLKAISDFIEQAKKKEYTDSSVHKVLKELINSFTQEEAQHALAYALEDKFLKNLEEDFTIEQDGLSAPQEICMELGRDHGFAEEQVRDYLYRTCKLLPQEISKVRVLNKKTFISIPENRLRDCMQEMRVAPITQQKYKIYLVQDIFRDKGKKQFGRDRDHKRSKHRDGGGFRNRKRKRY